MAIDTKTLMRVSNESLAAAREQEYQKKLISDTIRESLEGLEEGDVVGLVRIIMQSVTVSSLARSIENNLLGQGTFVPKWIRAIGNQSCATNPSTEYTGGSLKDLLDIDKALEMGVNLADAATAFWGGLQEVVKGRKLKRQCQSVGHEILLAKHLVTAIPDWATAQPLSGINAHFATLLNAWFGLSLPVKELEYFGSAYSELDYTAPSYEELEPAQAGSQANQFEETDYNLTIG